MSEETGNWFLVNSIHGKIFVNPYAKTQKLSNIWWSLEGGNVCFRRSYRLPTCFHPTSE